jgi:hypothetical protein
MADYTELEWRKKFRPKLNPTTGFDCYTPGEEDIVLENDDTFIWTEAWDWDSNIPYMSSGFMTEEDGAISWYVCEIPWEGDVLLIAEKSED